MSSTNKAAFKRRYAIGGRYQICNEFGLLDLSLKINKSTHYVIVTNIPKFTHLKDKTSKFTFTSTTTSRLISLHNFSDISRTQQHTCVS